MRNHEPAANPAAQPRTQLGTKPATEPVAMPRRSSLEDLRVASSNQAGVLSRQQLRTLGWNDTAIAYAVKSHRLAPITPGVLSTFTGEPNWLAHAWAAHLSSGTESYLTGKSALFVQGYGSGEFPIDIAIPGGSTRTSSHWKRVTRHRQRREITLRNSLPVAKAPDALLDALRDFTSPTDVRNFVADVYQKRAVSLDALSARIKVRRIPYRKTVVETVQHLRNGQTTPLEIPGVKNIVKAHGFPSGKGQAAIGRHGRAHNVDYVFSRFGTAIEFDGHLGHDDSFGTFRDMQRDNRAMLSGLRTLRFGMSDVHENACQAAAQLAHALRLGGWQGIPTKCADDCSVHQGYVWDC